MAAFVVSLFVVSLFVVAVFADSLGAEFGPTSSHHADNYIESAGGAILSIEGYAYSYSQGPQDELRYLGHHIETHTGGAAKTFVLGFTPQCHMAGGGSKQTCGLHSFELTGANAGNFVTETIITRQTALSGSFQWQGTSAIKQIDTGGEVNWVTSSVDDYYSAVWIVDFAGNLFHMHGDCQLGNNVLAESSGVLCTFADESAAISLPHDANDHPLGAQWVSSGGTDGFYSDAGAYCNVVIVAGDQAWYGSRLSNGNYGCLWAQISDTVSPLPVVSVAASLYDLYMITKNGTSFKIYSKSGVGTTAPVFSAFTDHSAAWSSAAGSLHPVFIDAWDSAHVRVVANDGSLWSFDGTNFASVTLPTGANAVFITKDTLGNIVYPTNVYLSVGPDAVYFSDALWGTGSSGNNWRIAYS